LKTSFAEMTPDLIAKAVKKAIGKEILLQKSDLENFKDAKQCVLVHKSRGGPAPGEVKKMIKDINLKLKSFQKEIISKEIKLSESKKLLEKEVNKIVMLN